MATAANGASVTTTGVSGSTVVFSAATDGGSCRKWGIQNRTASTGNVLVNIPGLHAASDWIGVAPGQYREFANGSIYTNAISTVNIKTDTSTATADYGVVEKV